MNEFEERLRQLPLRAPSDALDERIGRLLYRPAPEKRRESRHLGLGWAFAMALGMGVIGFGLGVAWRGNDLTQIQGQIPVKEVQIIIKQSDMKPFDFTGSQDNPPREKWKADVKHREEQQL